MTYENYSINSYEPRSDKRDHQAFSGFYVIKIAKTLFFWHVLTIKSNCLYLVIKSKAQIFLGSAVA